MARGRLDSYPPIHPPIHADELFSSIGFVLPFGFVAADFQSGLFRGG